MEFEEYTVGSSLVSKRSYNMDIYNLYLDEDIGEASRYRELIEALDFANDNDIVRLHINTDGGMLDTANVIRRAIMSSRAKVIGIVDGNIQSAGTMVMMACDDVKFGDLSWAMFHTASFGVRGDTNKVHSRATFKRDYLYNTLYTYYTGFLTEEEIEDMFHNSREIYMDSIELTKRWEAYVEYRDNLVVDIEQEEE